MNVGLVNAIALGLLRIVALLVGAWVILREPGYSVFGYGMITFATGFSVADKFVVDGKIKSASQP